MKLTCVKARFHPQWRVAMRWVRPWVFRPEPQPLSQPVAPSQAFRRAQQPRPFAGRSECRSRLQRGDVDGASAGRPGVDGGLAGGAKEA